MTHKGSRVVKPQHNHGIYPQLSIICYSFLTACQWYQWRNSLGNSASENMVDTISECSDQNVQLRRLTRVFARRTGRIGKPGDYRSQMRLVKALIRLLMCRLIRLIVPVFVGFVMHTHMRIVCANLDGKIFNRWHFSQFSKETDLAFHANCLHGTEWHIQFSYLPGNKKKKKKKKLKNLSSAELVYRVVIQKLRVWSACTKYCGVSKTIYLLNTLRCSVHRILQTLKQNTLHENESSDDCSVSQ